MLAIGCFIPIVLLVACGGIGLLIGGNSAGLWGAVVGFVLGCVILVVLTWSYERLIKR